MNCILIFYISSKTSLCEKAFKNSIKNTPCTLSKVHFATSPEGLGSKLIPALNTCNLVFIVGGLSGNEVCGTTNVLSNALSDNPPDDIFKLKSNGANDGYIVKKGNQCIVLLPDSPKEISAIVNADLLDYLNNIS